MFIGEFCKLTNTTPKTIRFYEAEGLLPEAQRQGKYRIYDDTYVETVRQIKIAQAHGFTLAELKNITQNCDIKRGFPPNLILQSIITKRTAIAEQIKHLQDVDIGLSTLEAEMKKSPCFVDSAPRACLSLGCIFAAVCVQFRQGGCLKV